MRSAGNRVAVQHPGYDGAYERCAVRHVVDDNLVRELVGDAVGAPVVVLQRRGGAESDVHSRHTVRKRVRVPQLDRGQENGPSPVVRAPVPPCPTGDTRLENPHIRRIDDDTRRKQSTAGVVGRDNAIVVIHWPRAAASDLPASAQTKACDVSVRGNDGVERVCVVYIHDTGGAPRERRMRKTIGGRSVGGGFSSLYFPGRHIGMAKVSFRLGDYRGGTE